MSMNSYIIVVSSHVHYLSRYQKSAGEWGVSSGVCAETDSLVFLSVYHLLHLCSSFFDRGHAQQRSQQYVVRAL